MKKLILSFLIIVAFLPTKAQYFQARVTRSVSGTSLEFYIRPNPTGANLTLKFDNIDMLIRWPDLAGVEPITGTPVVNTTDFPGLTMTVDPTGVEAYGNESGYKIRQWSSASANSTSTVKTYNAGVEYLVFSVPVTNAISNEIELAGNNEDGFPYYFTVTKNTAGLGGQSDFTSHNTFNGNLNNQLYYGIAPNVLSRIGQNFYQKIGAAVVNVNFTSFSATKKDNDGVLTWAVENESATTASYEVERSIDGITFDKITTLTPRGNGLSNNVYNITDANITSLKNSGILYYRIKQIDVNGRFVYSDIKNIRLIDKAGLISAYPNPTRDYTTVRIDAIEANDVVLTIVNAEGRQVMTATMQTQKGVNLKKLDLSTLAKGNYMIRATIGTEVKTLSVVKL
jgi:Secretion system C-terminal sorting domain